MLRAIKVLAPGELRGRAMDTLILTSGQRRNQRGVVTGEKGALITFDFAEPVALRTDDVLLLDTGETVEVVAAAEPLREVRGDIPTLSKVAHALGDRHLPAQIMTNRIRLHRAEGIAALVVSLGGKVTEIEAPFEPEGGAYGVPAHAGHDHAGHDHAGHDHAGHSHDHEHGHDHSHCGHETHSHSHDHHHDHGHRHKS